MTFQGALKFVADAAFAFLFSIVTALVLASLSAAGVITVTLAFVLLAAAWIVGILATFLMPHLWNPSHSHRLVFGLVLAACLFAIGLYEYTYKTSNNGTVTVDDASKCPPGYTIIENNTLNYTGTAVSMPVDADVCLVQNSMTGNGTGIELTRPSQ